MKNAKSTPGPWYAEGCKIIADSGTKYHRMKQIAGTVQMQHGDLHPEDKANARLMAAAPDLLEATKKLCIAIGGCRCGDEEEAAYQKCMAAIIKAEGETG